METTMTDSYAWASDTTVLSLSQSQTTPCSTKELFHVQSRDLDTPLSEHTSLNPKP